MAVTLSMKTRYANLWQSADIKPDWRSRCETWANKIIVNKPQYMRVQNETGVPWFFVGVLHMRESGCNFSKHLHNGDSLKAKTYRVPAGRPIGGKAPYDWYFSAADALRMKGLHKVVGWDIPTLADCGEKFNGLGYLKYHKNVLSPYLWQGTDHYCDADSACGKYVSDGKFSATERDQQCGIMAVLKVLEEMGEVGFAVKQTVRETVKGDRTIGALIGVLITSVAGFFVTVGEVIGRWLEILPGKVDETELVINTAGKVATWLGVPVSVWFTGGLAVCGVLLALFRAIQSARFVIPAADGEKR